MFITPHSRQLFYAGVGAFCGAFGPRIVFKPCMYAYESKVETGVPQRLQQKSEKLFETGVQASISVASVLGCSMGAMISSSLGKTQTITPTLVYRAGAAGLLGSMAVGIVFVALELYVPVMRLVEAQQKE